MQAQTLTRQRQVHAAQAEFLRSDALYRAFTGGRGAGKSWVGAYDLLRRAKRRRTYLVASPTAVVMGDTTFPTFRALAQGVGVWGPVTVEELPEVVFTPTGESAVKMTPYPTVSLTTGATVRFRSAQDPEKMRGPNLSGCWLDEASLMPPEAYQIVIASLREGGEQGWLSATFTPKGRQHWTYQTFGTARPDTALVKARTAANPFNPPGFEATLARQYPAALAEQELLGEFVDLAGEAWQVIPTEWARLGMARWTPEPPGPLDALGVDVARGGADRTCLARRHGAWVGPVLRHPGRSTPDGPAVAALVAQALRPNPLALVLIDVIGVGAAAYDAVVGSMPHVRAVPVNVAAGTDARDATGLFGFANLRAYGLWSLREALDPAGPVRLALPPDEELLAELTAAQWKMTLRGVQVEPKEEIQKRLGRSPDLADAVALACLVPQAAGDAGPARLVV